MILLFLSELRACKILQLKKTHNPLKYSKFVKTLLYRNVKIKTDNKLIATYIIINAYCAKLKLLNTNLPCGTFQFVRQRQHRAASSQLIIHTSEERLLPVVGLVD